MTDKPTPTDAELKAMWQIHAADIGGTPATGGEPAGTVGYTVHGTQYVNWRTKPPAHGTPIYTAQPPTQQEAQEPVAWESTTPGYIKYITQARYEKFSPAVRRWYKPYRCSGCAERGAGFDACDIATAAAQGFRDGQSTTKQEE